MAPSIERSPDKQPSTSEWFIEDRGPDVIWVMGVRDLGALVFRAEGKDFKGLSIFTKDDIQFENDIIGAGTL